MASLRGEIPRAVLGALTSPSRLAGQKHEFHNGHNYLMSWRVGASPETWFHARNFCRDRCMDLVSMETGAENERIKQLVQQGKPLTAMASPHTDHVCADNLTETSQTKDESFRPVLRIIS